MRAITIFGITRGEKNRIIISFTILLYLIPIPSIHCILLVYLICVMGASLP